MSEISLVITTLPNSDLFSEIATKLISEGLVACVNATGSVSSLFKWEGKICSAEEQILIMKTANTKLVSLEARLAELHPYKVFEFLVLPIEHVNAAYHEWVLQCCINTKENQ